MRSPVAVGLGLLLATCVSLAAAQGAVPSNTTTWVVASVDGDPDDTNQAVIAFFMPGAISTNNYYLVDPLTVAAYNNLPHDPSTKSSLNGSLVLNTPGTKESASSLRSEYIAYTSCDESDYQGEITMADAVNNAIQADVIAILFYSLQAPYCNLTNLSGFGTYSFLYTMTRTNDSLFAYTNLTGNYFLNQANLYSLLAFNNATSGGTGGTAVAMIILYSITGVITALFLVIIITGAVRAHRHPERYGPRNVLGRARQSRAKGIARAMLETIPIVKFGEPVPGDAKDVEDNTAVDSHELARREQPAAGNGSSSVGATDATTVAKPAEDGAAASAPAVASTETNHAGHDHRPEEEAQGCSICTDDFERGQDIRVLPCGHQYHPACVDPWLLEVSGTCPLCRVDLNPSNENETGDLPPPLNPEGENRAATSRNPRDTMRNFFNRGNFNLSRATGEERLEALRSWRAQHRTATGRQNAAAPSTARNDDAAAAEQHTSSSDAQPDQSRLGRLSRLVRRR